MKQILIILVIFGLGLGQQPAPIKCPLGAVNCYGSADNIIVSYCLNSVAVRGKGGNDSCDFSVRLEWDKISLTRTYERFDDDTIYFSVWQC